MGEESSVLTDQIKSRVRGTEEEFELKKRTVTRTNDKLKRYELRFLEAFSFHTKVTKFYTSLSVYIKAEEGEITFHGMEHAVETADEVMNALLNSLQTEKITDMSKNQKSLLETAETREIITEKFKSEQIAVWEVGKDVTVYGLSKEHVTKAVSNIRESVVQLSFELKPESAKLLDSREYLGFVEGLLEQHEGKLMIVPSQNGQQVCITGTNDIVHKAGEKVQNFIQENTIYSGVLYYSPSRQKFVATFWQDKLKLIANELKAYKVRLSGDHSELRASGTSEGLQEVERRLQRLGKEITVHVQTFSDPETVAFLTPGKCEGDLDLMGRCARCVLSLVPEPVVTPARGQAFGSVQCTGGTGTSVQGASAASICAINISIIEGEIAKQQQLRQVITKCLVEASNRHYGSVAFPVLGTGVLGYPTDVVARTLLDAIKQFELSAPSTTLREARIVVYHADKQALTVIQTIKQEMEGGQLIPSTVAHQVAQPSGGGSVGHSKPVATLLGRYRTAVLEKKANLYVYAESQNSVRAVLESLAKVVKGDITQRDLMDKVVESTPRQENHRPSGGTADRLGLPEHWDRHADTEQHKLLRLAQSGDEYQQVERNFRATLGDRNVTIISVRAKRSAS